MKFFIPHAKDKQQEKKVYEGIKKFAKDNTSWDIKERRIFSIEYAEVGKIENLIGEEVIAILESGYSNISVYLVCTPNRGVIRGMPILVGEESVYSIVDFDKE